jgi:alkylation response protein AidB-like acyl-CoA dehydrogenase
MLEDDRFSAECNGFRMILGLLNPERTMLAAEWSASPTPRCAATAYANKHQVFGRKISQNKPCSNPLAKCCMQVEKAHN